MTFRTSALLLDDRIPLNHILQFLDVSQILLNLESVLDLETTCGAQECTRWLRQAIISSSVGNHIYFASSLEAWTEATTDFFFTGSDVPPFRQLTRLVSIIKYLPLEVAIMKERVSRDYLLYRLLDDGSLEPLFDVDDVSYHDLPEHLQCPICNSEKPKLLLLAHSYESDPTGGEAHQQSLFFTPKPISDNESDAFVFENHQQRLFFTPRSIVDYMDISLLTKDAHFNPSDFTKYTLTVRCLSCFRFCLIAPAGLCSNRRFACEEPVHDTIPLEHCGTLVRQPCHECQHTHSFCTCCRSKWKHEHPHDSRLRFVNFYSSCPNCRKHYCESHAWLATVCCHS